MMNEITSNARMASALKASCVVNIDNPHGENISVRVFNGQADRTPLLLMHGLQSHANWFVQAAKFLHDSGHPVYAIDRRGSGLSQARRGHIDDFQDWVDDIEVVEQYVTERHRLGRVHLMGHCFGAIPSTLYAIQNADKLASLILPTPAIYTQSDLAFADKLRIVLAQLTRRTPLIPVPLSTELFTDDEEFRAFIGQDALSLSHATSSLYREVARARRYLGKNIERLSCPVYFAIAGGDRICNNQSTETLFQRITAQDKQLIEYPAALHILEFSSEREKFFADLAEWLDRH